MKKIIFPLIALFAGISLHAQLEFGAYESAVFLNVGNGDEFYNTMGTGIGTLSFENDLTNVNATDGLILQGAEVKTFTESGGNVCGVTMFYLTYPTGNRPANPTFSETDLPFFEDCDGTQFPNTGGPCGAGDQKWQRPGNDTALGLNLLDGQPDGDYSFEVYFEISGDNGGGACDLIAVDDNNGNNYTSSVNYSGNLSVIDSSLKDKVAVALTPDASKLWVNGLENEAAYKIYNANGQLVQKGNVENEISVNQLTQGVYFLQFQEADGKVHLQKFMKK